MNRTQKKCFIAATGFHLLLMVILFVGPAFLSSRNKADNMPIIEFVPMILTDKLVSGGGNPNANPPPAPPPQPPQQIIPPTPRPPSQVEKVEKQELAKDIKTTKPDPDVVEIKPRKPQVSTKLVKRSQTQTTKPSVSKPTSSTTASSSKEFTSAAQRIRESASSSTQIEMSGPGGGGPSYANYGAYVISKYHDAWILPEDLEEKEATVRVSVTIARDGTVISARITGRSGNSAVDRSVQSTLDRVTFIAPFPDGAKESQRTYQFNFKPKPTQLLG